MIHAKIAYRKSMANRIGEQDPITNVILNNLDFNIIKHMNLGYTECVVEFKCGNDSKLSESVIENVIKIMCHTYKYNVTVTQSNNITFFIKWDHFI